MRVQKTLSAQKVEINELKYRLEADKVDYDRMEVINKVKELEKINADLQHKEGKLAKLNAF